LGLATPDAGSLVAAFFRTSDGPNVEEKIQTRLYVVGFEFIAL
jgi:hypothetical protein